MSTQHDAGDPTGAGLSSLLRRHREQGSGAGPARLTTHRIRVACLVCADGAVETIAEVVGALLDQTRKPEEVHVIVSDLADPVFAAAGVLAGFHQAAGTSVFVHGIGVGRAADAVGFGIGLVPDADEVLVLEGKEPLDRDGVQRALTGTSPGGQRVQTVRRLHAA